MDRPFCPAAATELVKNSPGSVPGFLLLQPNLGRAKCNFLLDGRKNDLVIWILEHDPDQPYCLLPVESDVRAIDEHLSGVRFDQTAGQPRESRLAGSV